jgi:hypothetical protein
MQGGILGRDERWWDNLGRNKRGNNSGWKSRGGGIIKEGVIEGELQREG